MRRNCGLRVIKLLFVIVVMFASRSMPAFTKWPLHLVGRCWACAVEDVLQHDFGLGEIAQVHIISLNASKIVE